MVYVRRKDDISALPLEEETILHLRSLGVDTIGQMFDDPHEIGDAEHWSDLIITPESGYALLDWGTELPARSGKLYWSLDELGVLTVFGRGLMPDYAAGNMPPWHSIRKEIRNVHITEEVSNVGARAFEDCPALTALELDEQVTRIGCCAFRSCISLSDVRSLRPIVNWREEHLFPDAPPRIYAGMNAFRDTPWLTAQFGSFHISGHILMEYYGKGDHVTIPEGVEEIAPMVFEHTPLRSVTFPRSLRHIGHCAFQGTHIRDLILPANLETVDAWAFRGVRELEHVTLLGAKVRVDPTAFAGTPVEPFSQPVAGRWRSLSRLERIPEPGLGPFSRLLTGPDRENSFGTRSLNLQREIRMLLDRGHTVIQLIPPDSWHPLPVLNVFRGNRWCGSLRTEIVPQLEEDGTIRFPEYRPTFSPESPASPCPSVLGLRPSHRMLPMWYEHPRCTASTEQLARDLLEKWLTAHPDLAPSFREIRI